MRRYGVRLVLLVLQSSQYVCAAKLQAGDFIQLRGSAPPPLLIHRSTDESTEFAIYPIGRCRNK